MSQQQALESRIRQIMDIKGADVSGKGGCMDCGGTCGGANFVSGVGAPSGGRRALRGLIGPEWTWTKPGGALVGGKFSENARRGLEHYRSFMGEQKAQGKSHKEALRLWKLVKSTTGPTHTLAYTDSPAPKRSRKEGRTRASPKLSPHQIAQAAAAEAPKSKLQSVAKRNPYSLGYAGKPKKKVAPPHGLPPLTEAQLRLLKSRTDRPLSESDLVIPPYETVKSLIDYKDKQLNDTPAAEAMEGAFDKAVQQAQAQETQSGPTFLQRMLNLFSSSTPATPDNAQVPPNADEDGDVFEDAIEVGPPVEPRNLGKVVGQPAQESGLQSAAAALGAIQQMFAGSGAVGGAKKRGKRGPSQYQAFIHCMTQQGIPYKEALALYRDAKKKHGGNLGDILKGIVPLIL